MKRLLSVLLSLTLAALVLAPAAVPASAAAVKPPVINIVGEREVEVWKEDGTRYSPTEDMADAVVDDAIKELVPVFVKAFLTNNYDEWSRLALEKLTPIYDEIRPAPDGTLPDNTGPYLWSDMPEVLPEPNQVDSYYGYCWDFRKSPLDEVDSLHAFIQAVKEKTGAEKVVLFSRCGSVSLAATYLYKYGTADIEKVIFAASTLLGTPHADAILGGDVHITGAALYNYLMESDSLSAMDSGLVKFLNAMLYALNANGSADDTISLLMRVYDKIKDSFIAPFLRSYYAICGNYIASVNEHFDQYLDYVFPTAALKAEYAPILSKATEYHENVQLRLKEILDEVRDSGVPVYFIAFYGEPAGFPVSTRSSLVGDELVDADYQSCGATVSQYPGKLSDSYIAGREQAGFGAFISPDRQIDASTCWYPATTWFVKNMRHQFSVNVLHSFVRLIARTDGMTVHSNPDYPQFLTVVGNYTAFKPAEAVNERDLDTASKQPEMKTATGFFARIVAFFAKITAFFARLFHLIG